MFNDGFGDLYSDLVLFTILNVHRDPTVFMVWFKDQALFFTFHPPKSGFRDQIYQSRLDGGWYLLTSDDLVNLII